VHCFEVAVGKFVAAFVVLVLALVFTEVPLGILVDFVLLEEGVLGLGVGVVLAPVAFVVFELARFDEVFGKRNGGFIERNGHGRVEKVPLSYALARLSGYGSAWAERGLNRHYFFLPRA
jgi:hypothetical protein